MKRIFTVVAAVTTGSLLHAQDTTGKLLDEVIFTATKTPQKQSATGKVITVITKEQLEKSVGKTLSQVLNEQAGIVVNGAYNNQGSVQTVFMRGASSGRTLILLDGIPVNDPSMINNEFDLNLFSINDVERIEVCKGAQSTLYGSDAIAGVINIITDKKDTGSPVNIKVTTGVGNKNTFRNNLQLYGKLDKITYTSRFAKLSTNGFSAAHDNTGNGNFDKDGYDGNAINTALQFQAAPSLSLKTFIRHSQYRADVDAGVFSDDRDYRINNSSLSSGLGANFKKGIVTAAGNYQYGELKRKYLNDSLHAPGFTKFENNRYGGRTQFAELYGSIRAAKWLTLLAGGDYRWNNMNQQYYSVSSFGPYSSSFDDTSVNQLSFYSSLFFHLLNNKLNIEAGGRTNKHSRYGNNGTYTFNPSYIINKNWRVFGSIASGFKAPSIFQVYDVFSGNPDLKPERSVNYEAGVQLTQEKLSSRIVYFYRNIKNGIDFDYNSFQYFNFVKQKVSGLEIELSVKPVGKLTIAANYTFLEGEEQTQSRKNFADTTYGYLLRRPKNTANIMAGYQFTPGLFVSVSGKMVSRRYDIGGYQQEDVPLDGYFLVNAYLEYRWKKSVKFFADLQNITNKQFFDLRGYSAIPFLANGGISFEL